MKYFLFLILFIISCAPTEPEEIVDFVSPCGGPYGHDCGDYKLLEEFIESNSEIFRHYLDVNENDIVDAMEFGYQVWDYPGSGRLIWLDLNYPKDIIMKQDNPSELDLTNYRLTVIPEKIGDLDSLESLFLHDNEFISIPESIGNLTKLKMLDIENNLIADLPSSFGNLVNLERLVLSSNQITSLPESIGSLISLKKLWLKHNQLVSLPGGLGDLIQLEWLYLNNNLLEELPDGIGNLVNLKLLNIENNMISSIPESMCNEVNNNIAMYEGLETFSIGNNELCGFFFPACFDLDNDGVVDQNIGSQNCANCDPWEFNIEGYCADSTDYNILQNFMDLNEYSQSLPYNTGIPDKASECVNTDWWDDGRLIEITFYSKKLTSEIPENIGMLDKLEILDLHDNQLTGEIPSSIENLANLKELKLNNNYISGDIPENIGSLSNLESLWLKNNQLGCYEYDYECDPYGKAVYCCITHCYETEECNGEIPQSIANLGKLKKLYLNNNHFLRGSIPNNIGDLSSLQTLCLDKNQLSGGIPESIGSLSNLERLILQNNNLSGQIPESICTIANLTMYLGFNRLCPGEAGYPVCFPEAQIVRQDCQ